MAGFISSLYGILQYFGIEPIWPKSLNPFGGRSVSTFGNPTFLSSYLVLLLPLAMVFYLAARKTFVYFLILIAFFSGLLCTLTRSSWAGALAAFLILLFLIWRFECNLLFKKKASVIFIIMVFFCLAFFWPKSKVEGYNPTVTERLSETLSVKNDSYAPWHQRQLIWSCAWQIVGDSPLIGKGWGCFEVFYPFYQGRHLFLELYRDFRTHANNAHNEILEVWSQAGTLGLGIYIWLFFVFFSYGYYLIKNLSGENRLIAIGLFSSAAGMLFDNLLNVSINFPVPGFLFWWFTGSLAGMGSKGSKTVKLDSALKKSIVWLILISGILVFGYYITDFISEAYFFKGFKASRNEDLHKAVRCLELSKKLRLYEVNCDYELGNTYARLGMSDEAISNFKLALKANAGYDEIYFNLANMLARSGEEESAVRNYSVSLYINPLAEETYAALSGIFLGNLAVYENAGIKLLEQCAYFFPYDKNVWNNLGFLYFQKNDLEKALDAYQKAFMIDTDYTVTRKNRAVIFAKIGKKDKFLEEVDSLFKETQKNINSENWPKVYELSERLVKILPDSVKANLYLGNACLETGRTNDAINLYKKALKIDPVNPSLLGNMGIGYMYLKDYRLAKETFEKLLSVSPDNDMAKRKLKEIDGIVKEKSS